MRLAWLYALLAVPSLAVAQPAPEGDPLLAPGFLTLDRFDATARVGAEASLAKIPGASTLRFDLHGHVVDPGSGFGLYGVVPGTKVAGESEGTRLGNLELGGLWMRPVAPNVGLVLRAGLALPTMSDDGDDQGWRLAISRLADLPQVASGTAALRASASVIVRNGAMFARADVGVDRVVDRRGDNDATLVRVQPGVGIEVHDVAFTGELVLAHATGGTAKTVAFSARYLGAVQPYLGVVIPVDDTLNTETDVAVTLGLDVPL